MKKASVRIKTRTDVFFQKGFWIPAPARGENISACAAQAEIGVSDYGVVESSSEGTVDSGGRDVLGSSEGTVDSVVGGGV